MQRFIQFVVVVLFISTHHGSETLECSIPNQIRTRIFNSLVDYQANKYPFDPLSPEWLGSVVSFDVSTIGKLQKNSFVTKDSQHVLKMVLSGKRIGKIEDGAFLQLDCLHELLLDHNEIAKLSKDTFQGLSHLESLSLNDNHLTCLPDLAFSTLLRLKMLDLSNNQINVLESLTFVNLTMLEVLNLEFNRLNTVSVDVFLPLINLRSLNLGRNKLADIEPEKWLGLQKLESLNLAGNGLNHFDPAYNFSFSSLKTLNLSSNLLTELNVARIKTYLRSLELIDLNNNLWYCKTLTSIVNDLHAIDIQLTSNNNSESMVEGIACSETPLLPLKTTERTVQISTTTNKYEPLPVNKSYIEGIVEKKFKESSENVINSIRYLQSLVIFLFVILGVFIVFEIIVRTDCCRILVKFFRGGNSTYFDSSDVENYTLLRR